MGDKLVSEFVHKFPNLTQLYREYNVKLIPEQIMRYPDGISISEITDAAVADYEQYGVSRNGFISNPAYQPVMVSYAYEKRVKGFLETFTSGLTLDQLSQFEKLVESSNGAYEQYSSIIEDYNQAIKDLQQEFLNNLRLS